jgi:hypothetical protein
MKKYILSAISILLIISCNPSVPEEKYKKQNDSLITVIKENENSVKELISSINDMESSLDSITKRQHIISENYNKSGDVKSEKKLRINQEIKAINELMDQNKKRLAGLTEKLNDSNRKNTLLVQTIQTLKNQLDQKYLELDELNAKLNSLNLHVNQLQTALDSLSAKNLSLLQTNVETTNALHLAYYIVAEKKDLEKSKIIDNKGGLLGIGKTAKLNENIDNGYFTKIDYLETTSIAVNSKNMKIVTTHPPGSYNLEKDGKLVTLIMITDPEKFWSASKYLVVIAE